MPMARAAAIAMRPVASPLFAGAVSAVAVVVELASWANTAVAERKRKIAQSSIIFTLRLFIKNPQFF
jgi:hypothetical protein